MSVDSIPLHNLKTFKPYVEKLLQNRPQKSAKA